MERGLDQRCDAFVLFERIRRKFLVYKHLRGPNLNLLEMLAQVCQGAKQPGPPSTDPSSCHTLVLRLLQERNPPFDKKLLVS
jgi:hypothetical protein